jgi:hypothetical protein
VSVETLIMCLSLSPVFYPYFPGTLSFFHERFTSAPFLPHLDRYLFGSSVIYSSK